MSTVAVTKHAKDGNISRQAIRQKKIRKAFAPFFLKKKMFLQYIVKTMFPLPLSLMQRHYNL